ncbi:MAG: RNA polymerase sigma factor, partial [Pseudomonadota bacterium]
MFKNSSDAELLRAVAEKNTSAFKTFMEKYQRRVFLTVFRFIGDAEISRDLVQDIFLKVYHSARSYSPDCELFTWLYQIIANHCINFNKKHKSDPLSRADKNPALSLASMADPKSISGQQHTLEKQEQALLIRCALDSLPPRQKMAITLLRFEELRYQEIARVLNCSVPA